MAKEKTLEAKTKKDDLTQLVLTGDFQQELKGEITPGSQVTILFDSARLPFERSVSAKGKPEWTISAFYQIAPSPEVNEIKLIPEKSKTKSETVILKGVLSVPATGSEVVIWFLNTGSTGEYYFDSDFGKNYRFPIAPAVEAPVKKS